MKQLKLIILLIFIETSLFGQNNDTWTSFWNNDSTLIGYKDKNNIVKIPPQFSLFQTADKFDNIIAVTDEVNGELKTYYLSKLGKTFGKDSLHSFDNTYDCENEGFVRFRDRITDKVGMFNRKGEIIVPAEYNELTKVINGLIVGLKGAEKKFWDKEKHSDCNHFSWTGGKEVLIDTLNNLLVDSFSYEHKLNLFSLEQTDNTHSDTIRKSFIAKNGKNYSFIDFEKEFKQWLNKDLLIDFSIEKLVNASYNSIIWQSSGCWDKTDKQTFINRNFPALKASLLEISDSKWEHFIFMNSLNSFMYEGAEFEKYYNNCGQGKEWIYPVMELVISSKKKKKLSQNSFTFLKTDSGYKLINVTIRTRKIK